VLLSYFSCSSKDGSTTEFKQYIYMCVWCRLLNMALPYTEVSLLQGHGVDSLRSDFDVSGQRKLLNFRVTNVHWRFVTGILTIDDFLISSSCVISGRSLELRYPWRGLLQLETQGKTQAVATSEVRNFQCYQP
jgi:hypothetical protein